MIMQSVDNLMLGGVEVEKAYCGDALVWERGGGRVIPAGYEEQDYAVNPVFNTLFRPQSGVLRFECKVTPKVPMNDKVFLGGYLSDPVSYADTSTVQLSKQSNSSVRLMQIYTNDTGRHGWALNSPANSFPTDVPAVISGTFSLEYQILTVNGTTYQQAGVAVVLPRDVWYGSNGSANTDTTSDLYYLKLYDDATLARDMVPVKRLSDETVGMWDFVTSSFYTYS